MPIRSGAIQRPSGCRYGNMLRQRYDEVGLPCCNTMGSPSPTSTYAISLPRTCRRFFWYGNAAEIMFASPVVGRLSGASRTHYRTIMPASDQRRSALITVAGKCLLYSETDRIAAWPRNDAKCQQRTWGQLLTSV